PIGVVGFDVAYHMVCGIYRKLALVIELSGLTGFYTDARIGIGGAVMGFVAGVATAFIARFRTLY
ncbi:hypothetical protein, partial [Xanthomarina gelatinilytica]|uniref:hypothetical protein n=1 Tax=Xanthomarina gelatinilytica TaxID=1137281 RepID=UPI003AA8DD39